MNRAEPEPQEAAEEDTDEDEESEEDETDKDDETDNSGTDTDKEKSEDKKDDSKTTGNVQSQSDNSNQAATPQGPLYPEDRWAVLQQRLTETAAVLEGKSAGQTDLDTAYIGLRGAVTGLTLDTKALTELCLAYAGQWNDGQYSAGSWAAFEEAYTAALEALAAGTEQEALDAATQALKDAGNGLGLDKSVLEARIKEAAALEKGGR